ncbi:hypothetical protein DFH27DRAFT_520880 [Peziza echinospora]|nr:hypothetical protein DFH27DRAFT_520880 [Peziza echinospora]
MPAHFTAEDIFNGGASFYDILDLPAPTLLPNGGGLPTSPPQLTSQAVKKAYHRALLRWHPDKSTVSRSPPSPPSSSSSSPTPSSWRSSTNSNSNIQSPGSPGSPRSPRSPPTQHQPQPSPKQKQKDGPPVAPSPAGYTLDQILTAYTTLSTDRGRRTYEREFRLNLLLLQTNPTTNTNINAPTENVDLSEFIYHEQWSRHTRSCRCGEEEGFVVLDHELAESVGPDGKGEVVVGCAGCSLWVRVGFGVMGDDEDEDDGYHSEGDERPSMENLGTIGGPGAASGTSKIGVPGIGRREREWGSFGLGEAV